MKNIKIISFIIALVYVSLGTFTLFGLHDNEFRVLFLELLTFPLLVIGMSILYGVPRESFTEVLFILQPLVFIACWFLFYKTLKRFVNKRRLKQTISQTYIQPSQVKRIKIISSVLAFVYVFLGAFALFRVPDNESRILFLELLTFPLFLIEVSILTDVPQEIYTEVLFTLQPLVFVACWFLFYKISEWFIIRKQLKQVNS